MEKLYLAVRFKKSFYDFITMKIVSIENGSVFVSDKVVVAKMIRNRTHRVFELNLPEISSSEITIT